MTNIATSSGFGGCRFTLCDTRARAHGLCAAHCTRARACLFTAHAHAASSGGKKKLKKIFKGAFPLRIHCTGEHTTGSEASWNNKNMANMDSLMRDNRREQWPATFLTPPPLLFGK